METGFNACDDFFTFNQLFANQCYVIVRLCWLSTQLNERKINSNTIGEYKGLFKIYHLLYKITVYN